MKTEGLLITPAMESFREGVRHCWNVYFRGADEPMSPTVQEAFEEVERGLFRALIAAPLHAGSLADGYRSGPARWISLRPKDDMAEVWVQWGALDTNQNVVWELPVEVDAAEVSDLVFESFFDWNPYGCIDLALIRAREGNTDRSSRCALLRFDEFEFLATPKAEG